MERILSLPNKFGKILLVVISFHFLFLLARLDFKVEVLDSDVKKILNVKIVKNIQSDLDKKNKKQIVQSEDSHEILEEIKNNFLSDKNRTFERQSVAKKVDSFKEATRGNSSRDFQNKIENVKKKSKKDVKLSDLGIGSSQEFDMNPQDTKQVAGEMTEKPNSFSSSSTNDFVNEVQLGDFTRLNTTEYKHYGFFHRIRQKLEQFWGKSIREKANALYRNGRRIPASENLITSLQVILNEEGEIISVKIISTSGIRELDDAAINSFNQAGPFPNPPKDLLVNGRAVIEWGFVVKS